MQSDIIHFFFIALSIQVVVITGASSGLGEALAHSFYTSGCKVVLAARRKDELERVRNDLLEIHPVSRICFIFGPFLVHFAITD